MKMKVLVDTEKYLEFLGIGKNLSTPKPEKIFLRTFNSYVVLLCFVSIIVSGAINLFVHSVDIAITTNTLICLFGTLACAGAHFGIIFNFESVSLLHKNLQEIVDETENEEIIRIYRKAEDNCQSFSTFLRKSLLYMGTFGILALAMIYSCVCMWQGNYDTSTWYLPYYLYVPFDTSTVFGWYLQLPTTQAIFCYSYTYVSATTICYFVNSCIYIVACCDQLKLMIGIMNEKFTQIPSRVVKKSKVKNKGAIEGRIVMIKMIEFQKRIFFIFELVSRINSALLFFQLLGNVLFLSSAIFKLEESFRHFSLNGIAYYSACIAVSVFWSLFLCFGATITSERVRGVGDLLYNCDWITYPGSINKSIIFIMTQSQNEIYFRGLKVVPCNLSTFVSVIHTPNIYFDFDKLHFGDFIFQLNRASFTYYMTFRRIAKL